MSRDMVDVLTTVRTQRLKSALKILRSVEGINPIFRFTVDGNLWPVLYIEARTDDVQLSINLCEASMQSRNSPSINFNSKTLYESLEKIGVDTVSLSINSNYLCVGCIDGRDLLQIDYTFSSCNKWDQYNLEGYSIDLRKTSEEYK